MVLCRQTSHHFERIRPVGVFEGSTVRFTYMEYQKNPISSYGVYRKVLSYSCGSYVLYLEAYIA